MLISEYQNYRISPVYHANATRRHMRGEDGKRRQQNKGKKLYILPSWMDTETSASSDSSFDAYA